MLALQSCNCVAGCVTIVLPCYLVRTMLRMSFRQLPKRLICPWHLQASEKPSCLLILSCWACLLLQYGSACFTFAASINPKRGINLGALMAYGHEYTHVKQSCGQKLWSMAFRWYQKQQCGLEQLSFSACWVGRTSSSSRHSETVRVF